MQDYLRTVAAIATTKKPLALEDAMRQLRDATTRLLQHHTRVPRELQLLEGGVRREQALKDLRSDAFVKVLQREGTFLVHLLARADVRKQLGIKPLQRRHDPTAKVRPMRVTLHEPLPIGKLPLQEYLGLLHDAVALCSVTDRAKRKSAASSLSANYIKNLLRYSDMQTTWIWLVSNRRGLTRGFGIGELKQAAAPRSSTSTVFHVHLLCSTRGHGQHLFNHMLSWALTRRVYGVEISYVTEALRDKYRKWFKEASNSVPGARWKRPAANECLTDVHESVQQMTLSVVVDRRKK